MSQTLYSIVPFPEMASHLAKQLGYTSIPLEGINPALEALVSEAVMALKRHEAKKGDVLLLGVTSPDKFITITGERPRSHTPVNKRLITEEFTVRHYNKFFYTYREEMADMYVFKYMMLLVTLYNQVTAMGVKLYVFNVDSNIATSKYLNNEYIENGTLIQLSYFKRVFNELNPYFGPVPPVDGIEFVRNYTKFTYQDYCDRTRLSMDDEEVQRKWVDLMLSHYNPSITA